MKIRCYIICLKNITRVHDGIFFKKGNAFNDGSACFTRKYSIDGESVLLRLQSAEEGSYSKEFKFSAAPNDGFLLTWGGGYMYDEWVP